MEKKPSLFRRIVKSLLVLSVFFVIVSTAMDWYRKPVAPAQFAEQVLYDIEQQPKVIAQLSHQQPMVLYFWGSWCHYCHYTSPSIAKLADEGTPILGVAIKSGDDKTVADYLAKENYRFKTINDPNADFARSWKVRATPSIMIIKDGQVVHHTTGLTSYWGLKLRLWLSQLL